MSMQGHFCLLTTYIVVVIVVVVVVVIVVIVFNVNLLHVLVAQSWWICRNIWPLAMCLNFSDPTSVSKLDMSSWSKVIIQYDKKKCNYIYYLLSREIPPSSAIFKAVISNIVKNIKT